MQVEHLKIDTEPKHLLVTSEPYVIFSRLGYSAVINVLERRSRKEYFIYISPKSLACALEALRNSNNGKTTGLEFWLRKESDERTAGYILED